ncbi:MAG: hypothetical protein HY364_03755 [Candidatus Aenigmarchaeota archaeon]|nr:hypothetical protein [Candidatus Aenigmarchaeota archaeon]
MERHHHLILWDIGGVLLRLNYGEFYDEGARLSGTLTPEQFKDAYIESRIDYRAMKGVLDKAMFISELRRILKRPIAEQDVKNFLKLSLGRPYPPTLELKERAHRSGYPVGVLSNASQIVHEILKEDFPETIETFSRENPAVFSYQVGSVKPEDEIYKAVPKFDEVTFIDDKVSYVKKAIDDFGWNGILFTPIIDKHEAIRAEHNDVRKPLKNFAEAGSTEQLVEALNRFGISLL